MKKKSLRESLTAQQLQRSMRAERNAAKARDLMRFFKTGPGEYAAGDRFLGLTVPQTRIHVRTFRDLPLGELEKLLRSTWHEERLCALLIQVDQFRRAQSEVERAQIYRSYVRHLEYINNWDLVDSSAAPIVGAYLDARPTKMSTLLKWARSSDLWTRRVAIIATHYDIRRGFLKDALKLAEILLEDSHDLIHKAVGWTLRECGKQEVGALRKFLDRYAGTMPRTALRYALEHLPLQERNRYMRMKEVLERSRNHRASQNFSKSPTR